MNTNKNRIKFKFELRLLLLLLFSTFFYTKLSCSQNVKDLKKGEGNIDSSRGVIDENKKQNDTFDVAKYFGELERNPPTWRPVRRDTSTERYYYVVDDTVSWINNEDSIKFYAHIFTDYITMAKGSGKPVIAVVFTRKPREIPVSKYIKRGTSITSKLNPNYKKIKHDYLYVGNKNEIKKEYLQEWKDRFLFEYDAGFGKIVLFPQDISKRKIITHPYNDNNKGPTWKMEMAKKKKWNPNDMRY